MKSHEIRKLFFNYFIKNGHTKIESSSLIPAQDPTLLFTNAGMNQFKDVFLGQEKRSYSRAVSIQKCVRAGGKHNDLDNVGFTKRHLTFFEMMGNFSFGDYFKKEAINFAWEFLTKEIRLPTHNLHVSVFETDDESYDIWHKNIGLSPEKIHRLGEAENFWQMGDLGPCGPCSEIHIDRGPEFGCKEQCDPACECDRFLEIWNLVFMQFDRQPDGSLKPLSKTGVDTGMGIERLCSVVQNVDSVFETDLFSNIIKKIEQLTGIDYEQQHAKNKAAFHVLADHVRSSTLLIADGCAPSNDGRGYVLRKIIRRAALFAQKLTDKNIFPKLSQVVVQDFSDIYPELEKNKELIFKVLDSEIKKFTTNLIRGQQILDDYFKKSQHNTIITGQQAFKLYDTYGFPVELVKAAAKEQGYTVDEKGFSQFMEQQKQQSGKKLTDPLDHLELDPVIKTEFTGYQELETASHISALIDEKNEILSIIPENKTCWVIAQKSPFFIVGGGQVPDEGWLIINQNKIPIKHVRYINGRIAAQIKTPHKIQIGDTITSIVDNEWRTKAMKNHTATHLLQSALIELFGKHIKQSGSLVHPDYLRFDFTYHENLQPEDIKKVENLVNKKIMENIPVRIEYMPLKQALDQGALAFFGDKYNPENVRMVQVADFSTELCGGTHVPATGVIGVFKITEVSALSAGHRRIIAVTGPKALDLFQESYDTVKSLSQEFKVKREDVLDTVLKQKDQIKELQTEIKQIKKQTWKALVPQWQQEITTINNMPFLFIHVQDYAHDEMKEIADYLARKKPGLYFLISSADNKSIFLATLSTEFQDHLNMKNFGSWLKELHGLRGGGAKDSIQGGGGKFDSKLKEAIFDWLKQKTAND